MAKVKAIRSSGVLDKFLIISGLMTAFIVGFLMSDIAKAQTIEWSWVENSPTVFSAKDVDDMAPGMCPNYYQTKEIDGYLELQKVCLNSGDIVRFGTFYSDYAWRAAVGFKNDTKMYKVNGLCSSYNPCLYLPEADTLVVKQYENYYVKSLAVYKHFTSRLIPAIKFGVISTLEYNFDFSNPDYVFRSSTGYAWPIGGIGASENGKWLAMEIKERGIGLLNLETLEMKRISTLRFQYGHGYDATTELAVSNDGRHVVVAGMNAHITLLEVTDSCGDEPNDYRLTNMPPIASPCRTSPINTESFIYRFYAALQPSLSSDGAELRFYAIPYVGKVKYVTLRASGYEPRRLDYLALGDSFSSGEGETEDSHYLVGTNDEFEKCHVSDRSYPFLLAQSMGIEPEYMRSVACSGAKSGDIDGQSNYEGQNDRLGINGQNYNTVDMRIAKDIALREFVPGRIWQSEFVRNYKPNTATIGIGGNDLGFMEKLNACVGPGTCDVAVNPQKLEQTGEEIKSLFGTLVETYNKLHQGSPSTKIYVIGYPNIVSLTGYCPDTDFWLNASERVFMYNSVKYLNQVIEAAARAAGVKYVDIWDSFGEKVICGSEQPMVVNTIRLGDDIDPVPLIDSRFFRLIGAESFHPNPSGHDLTAGLISQKLGNLLDYNYCQNGETVCPDVSSIAPSLPSYFQDGDSSQLPMQKYVDVIRDISIGVGDLVTDTAAKLYQTVEFGVMSFAPNSEVTVEVHSTPLTLGVFSSGSDGSANLSFSLPSDLEEGYHELHILGKTYTGNDIDYYQIFLFTKEEAVVPDDEDVVVDDDDTSTSDEGNSNGEMVDGGNTTGNNEGLPSEDTKEPETSNDDNGELAGDTNDNEDKTAYVGAEPTPEKGAVRDMNTIEENDDHSFVSGYAYDDNNKLADAKLNSTKEPSNQTTTNEAKSDVLGVIESKVGDSVWLLTPLLAVAVTALFTGLFVVMRRR